MPASENFRRNLRTAIDAKDLSLTQVAETAGMQRPYVSRVLNGHTNPLMDQAERLSKAVGFPLDFLIRNPKEFSEAVLTGVTE